ncbi:MAG TPA: hypothetical protein VM470_08355 [Acidimicrobiia bacterium]|nr:hypothetical protein [Acidimicrobiia bacterium]
MSIGGLRQRLENLEGVSAIHLELAETGLSGIKVSLDDGADESGVLERIRSLLVTYGLRSPPAVSTEVDLGRTSGTGITTVISPEGEGMRVEVTGRGQSVVKLVDATPMAAAQAVAEGRARLSGHPVPNVLWIGLDSIGGWRILTVLVRVDEATPTVGASLVEGGWAEALDQAVATALSHQADSK